MAASRIEPLRLLYPRMCLDCHAVLTSLSRRRPTLRWCRKCFCTWEYITDNFAQSLTYK
jgi:hypothetical protein